MIAAWCVLISKSVCMCKHVQVCSKLLALQATRATMDSAPWGHQLHCQPRSLCQTAIMPAAEFRWWSKLESVDVGWSCFGARFVAQVWVRKSCSRAEQAGNLTAKVAPPPPRPLLLFITNVKNARTVWVLTLAWVARIARASTCEDMQNFCRTT